MTREDLLLTDEELIDIFQIGGTLDDYSTVICQAQLDRILKPEWKDKPDSEGWWIMRLELGAVYYSLHKIDTEFIKNCESHKEIRWTKAIIPEIEEK